MTISDSIEKIKHLLRPAPESLFNDLNMRTAFSNWGHLTTEKCAQYGIEAFVGMVSETHYNCSHFWCTPTPDGMDLNVKARMYYAVNPEEDTDFIGVHLFNPVKTIGDGIVFSDVPVQKLVIQPTCDGRLGILMGFMDHSSGLIDEKTATGLFASPRHVPVLKSYLIEGVTPIIFCKRKGRVWHIDQLDASGSNQSGDEGYEKVSELGRYQEDKTKSHLLYLDIAGKSYGFRTKHPTIVIDRNPNRGKTKK